jgi:methyl-accepting chemotaxis protein
MDQQSEVLGSGADSGSAGDRPSEPKPRRAWRLGLLGKASITLLFVGLAPLIAFGVFTLSQQNDTLQRDADKSLQTYAEYMSAQVDEWFDRNVRALRAAVKLPEIATMQRSEQAKVLLGIKEAYPWMWLVFTIGLDGNNVGRSDESALTPFKDRQYYKDLVSGGKDVAWETVIGKTSHKPSLVIAIPILVNGAMVGVLATSMVIEDKSLASWRNGDTGFAFLVDDKSKVLAHPRADLVLEQTRLDTHPMIAAYHADSKPHFMTFMHNGNETRGYVQGTKAGWAVVAEQSTQELLAPLRATANVGILLLAGALVLVILIGVMASRILVRPIVAMTAAADRMSLGELRTPIAMKGNDELSVLARSLERLRKSMRAAMARIRS